MVDKAQSGPLHLMKNSIQNNEQKNKPQWTLYRIFDIYCKIIYF